MVAPCYDKLFSYDPKPPKDAIGFNSQMKQYFGELFTTICLFVDLKSLTKFDPTKDKLLGINRPSQLICSYCQDAASESCLNDVLFQTKLNNEYAKSCLHVALNGGQDSQKPFRLSKTFVKNYGDLKFLLISNAVVLGSENKLFNKVESLMCLEISNTSLAQLPESLFGLKHLQILKLINNPIKELRADLDRFESLCSLKNFEIDNLNLNISPKDQVRLPESLENLNLTNMRLNRCPFMLGTTKLTHLTISGVPLFSSEESNAQKKLSVNLNAILDKYSKLIETTQLRDIFSSIFAIDAESSEYLNHQEQCRFNAFIFRKFARLDAIPMDVFVVKSLRHLDLSYQAIKQVPDEIESLINLNSLTLHGCILLVSISPRLANLSINLLDINECISLQTPPPEIQRRGTKSIILYLKRLLSGQVTCKRTKLMFVGLGEAGKTSLLKALRQDTANDHEEVQVTDGIDIKEWQVTLEDKTQLTYSMWDFAGQSVYYNTHQFFLSAKRSIYILVWNVRLGSEYAGLEFWLSSITCHAPGAPVFIGNWFTKKFFFSKKL